MRHLPLEHPIKPMLPNPVSRIIAKSFKPLVLTAFSLTGMGLGLLPSLSPHTASLVWMAPAQAQSFSDEQIKDYASALIEIEALRQSVRTELKEKMGSNIPNLICDDPKTLDAFPLNLRGVAKTYCDESTKIVEKYGLTTKLFNEITAELPGDATLRKRIQDAMRR